MDVPCRGVGEPYRLAGPPHFPRAFPFTKGFVIAFLNTPTDNGGLGAFHGCFRGGRYSTRPLHSSLFARSSPSGDAPRKGPAGGYLGGPGCLNSSGWRATY